MTTAELARRMNLHPTRCLELLKLLEADNQAERDDAGGWRLSDETERLHGAALRGLDPR